MAARLDHRQKASSKHLPSSMTKKDIHAHKHGNFKELKCYQNSKQECVGTAVSPFND
jgi:hypothetical protein